MKKIQEYLNNQLSEEEDDQITRVLLSNYYDRSLQKRWEQQLSEQYGLEAPQKTKAKVRYLPKSLMAVAATFLLFVLAYQLNNVYSKPTSQELVAIHLSDRYPHPNNRKGLRIEDARNNAIDAYVQENYKSSIYYYDRVVSSDDNTIDDYFFLGLSYLYSKQPMKAIEIFKVTLKQPIVADSSTRSKEIIHWYLGLAYFQVEDTVSAVKELQTIKGPKKNKAKELLDAL